MVVASQLIKLGAVINDQVFQSKRANLEYVDIRFTRVYLKEKTPATETQTIIDIQTDISAGDR